MFRDHVHVNPIKFETKKIDTIIKSKKEQLYANCVVVDRWCIIGDRSLGKTLLSASKKTGKLYID